MASWIATNGTISFSETGQVDVVYGLTDLGMEEHLLSTALPSVDAPEDAFLTLNFTKPIDELTTIEQIGLRDLQTGKITVIECISEFQNIIESQEENVTKSTNQLLHGSDDIRSFLGKTLEVLVKLA